MVEDSYWHDDDGWHMVFTVVLQPMLLAFLLEPTIGRKFSQSSVR